MLDNTKFQLLRNYQPATSGSCNVNIIAALSNLPVTVMNTVPVLSDLKFLNGTPLTSFLPVKEQTNPLPVTFPTPIPISTAGDLGVVVNNSVISPANVAIVQGGFAPSLDVNIIEVNGNTIVGDKVPVALNG